MTPEPSSSKRPPYPCTLYPLPPPNARRLTPSPPPYPHTLSLSSHLAVIISSLTVVGAVAWLPLTLIRLYRTYRSLPSVREPGGTDPTIQRRKRILKWSLVLCVCIGWYGPHRREKVGQWLNFKDWKLWKSWMRFVALEVLTDAPPPPPPLATTTSSNNNTPKPFNHQTDPSIHAIIPHGVFPFALGFACLPRDAVNAFGPLRPVVATATRFLPLVSTFIQWMGGVDASPSAVSSALLTTTTTTTHGDNGGTSSSSRRIGMSPGGIAEMFEGYPKPGRLIDEECCILKNRTGFIKMAIQHNVPVVPVYCFGGSKLMKRLQLPGVVERISNWLRVGVCLFFGQWGLPVPFRRKLLYVVGKPVMPVGVEEVMERLGGAGDKGGGVMGEDAVLRERVAVMHEKFCNELTRLFESYKALYGWDHKTLRIV